MIFLTALTVLILLVYTKETYLLRKESQKQTTNLLTPYLAFKTVEGDLYLANLGSGIAKDIIFGSEAKISGQPLLNINAIGAGSESKLYYPDTEEDGYWAVHLRDMPESITLSYFDQLGNKYEAKYTNESRYKGGYIEVCQKRL